MTGAPRVGFVVNPIAGMGGRVGLHGTDGAALEAALARGAHPVAPYRAQRALSRLQELVPHLALVTVPGAMGTDHLPSGQWDVTALPAPGGPTTAADTRAAVSAMAAVGVALVLFVGGDGTARDVRAAVDDRLPLLGIPAGVKMHSGVFATAPEAAADIVARFLAAPGTRTAEVVDDDGDGPRLFSLALVPATSRPLQAAKASGGRTDDGGLAALGRELAAELRPGVLHLLGPGTTVAHVNAALGVASSPLGVDAVLDGRLLARDANEAELLALLAAHPSAHVVLGVVGGQGFLLGRGNQQLSAAVLTAVGPENIDVLAAPSKLAALDEPVLRVDLDDPVLATHLAGYRRVRTGPGRSTVLRVATS